MPSRGKIVNTGLDLAQDVSCCKQRVLALGLALSFTATAGPVEVDSRIPDYSKTSGISGNLDSIGSDTLNNLMTFLSEGFRKELDAVAEGEAREALYRRLVAESTSAARR